MDITCGVFIIRKNKDILFCHPTNSKKKYISIPKGIMDEGETHMGAALREVYEETGLCLEDYSGKVTEIDEMLIYPKNNKKCLKSFIFETEETFENFKFKCTTDFEDKNGNIFPEIDGWIWVPFNKIDKYIIHSTQLEILNKYIL